MRVFILQIFIPVSFFFVTNGQAWYAPEECIVPDLETSYQKSMFDLTLPVYRIVAVQSNVNFVIALHSIWIILSAIAEGCDKETQQQLFKILNLPEDPCARQKFYEVATTRAITDNGVNIMHSRILLADENLTFNPMWLNIVSKNSLLDVATAPIKSNPVETANQIKSVMRANVPKLNLTGNSVLLDATDYNGLWTTAFADAVIERSPFYSLAGEHIGAVDLMKVKRRARMGYIKHANAKVLELPVGSNGHYRMLFVMLLDGADLARVISNISNTIILETINSLKVSNVPIDVAIPRMALTGEVDVRTVLEYLGVKSIWTDPEVTKYISTPPALPSSYVQRTTATIDIHGVAAPPLDQDTPEGTPTGLDPEVGTDFIANQPFLFGLFDAETFTPLVVSGYTVPTYS